MAKRQPIRSGTTCRERVGKDGKKEGDVIDSGGALCQAQSGAAPA